MHYNYYEDLYQADQRQTEWRMLNIALRQRRRYAFRRNLLSAAFWILGIR